MNLLRCTLLLIIVGLLNGCVAATVAAGGAAAGGAVATDPRESKTVFGDQNISYNVSKLIDQNKALSNASNIDVTTYNGIVLLTGQTPTVAYQQQAAQLAQTVSGVKMIYNQIVLGEPVSTSVHAKDTWITTKVRSELIMTQGWSSNDFKVVTENGVVYVMGIVKPAQAQLATEAISKVSGVEKVVTLLNNTSPAK